MSRSRKKHPCITWCGNTNKLSKRTCNRIFRKLSKRGIIDERYMPFDLNQAMNVYNFNSDGLAVWHTDLDKKFMRK